MNFISFDDLKELSVSDVIKYSDEIRQYLIDTVTVSGGHLASNLGIVEISLGLLRVFDPNKDKIIYDVGHQSYVHKLLTGRVFDKHTLRAFGGYSGFTKREESIYDPFGAGHSSTSVSAAVGFAKAAKLKGEDYHSIAVIGDGAFGNGMVFEALNNIDADDDIIIILNDNEMSISKNVGALSKYLIRIRSTKKYLKFKKKTKKAFLKMPVFGKSLAKATSSLKYFVKRIVVHDTLFEDMGVYYLGPADGNDIRTVELLLNEAKNRKGPVLVHLCTKKGKGYEIAEADPDKFHSVSGTREKEPGDTFSEHFSNALVSVAAKNNEIVTVTAAMSKGTGLEKFKNTYPDRFFDVGISEEHGMTFCSALSASGLIPVYAIYSTFLQRAYDQLLHDVLLQKLKVILAIDRAGLCTFDGATHHGIFDVPMLMSMPNISVYSPATYADFDYSFGSSVVDKCTCAVRYHKGDEVSDAEKLFKTGDYSLSKVGTADVLFVTYGRIISEVIKAKKALESVGINCVVLKFVKIKPINFNAINKIINDVDPKLICTVEESIIQGGFGVQFVSNIDSTADKIVLGINGIFPPHGDLQSLYDLCGISAKNITMRVIKWKNK